MKSGKYEDAATAFSKVHPASRLAGAAKNYLAVCHLVTGDSDAAEKDCLELLEKDPDDVQALSTYCAVLIEKKQTAKSREIARRLASISTENPDELYKIATVCCESGLDAEAYEKFCVLEEIVRYDLTLIYFKSVAACKCGKYRESLEGFGKIIDVFPQAEVARYYYNAMRLYLEEGGQPPRSTIFINFPKPSAISACSCWRRSRTSKATNSDVTAGNTTSCRCFAGVSTSLTGRSPNCSYWP